MQVFSQAATAEVHVDTVDVRRDTLDFGMVLFKGGVVARTVFVKNTGSKPLSIPLAIVPYFSIGRINAGTEEHREFRNGMTLPFSLPQSQAKYQQFRIDYNPENDTSQTNFPLGERIARLNMAFCPLDDKGNCTVSDPDSLAGRRQFILSVYKTKDFLAVRKKLFSFDSTYVRPFAPPIKVVELQNLSALPLTVEKQTLQFPAVTSASEFIAEVLSLPGTVSARQPLPVHIRYNPLQRGTDSASMTLQYSPNIDGNRDSAFIRLHGFGVEQQLELGNVWSERGIKLVGDTLELEPIASGSETRFYIPIINRGNINIGFSPSLIEGDESVFTVDKDIRVDRHLRVLSVDTLEMRFRPKSESIGMFFSSILLRTDILSRVASAPDSVSRKRFYIRARAVAPVLNIQNAPGDTLDFGSISLPYNTQCLSNPIRKSLIIRNIGNDVLRMNVPVITQNPTNYTILNARAEEINPGQALSLEIEFSALPSQTEGVLYGAILIRSNVPAEKERTVIIKATVLKPDVIPFALPTIRSVPGEIIAIPIVTSRLRIIRAYRWNGVMGYDSTHLQYLRIRTFGASAAGNVSASPNGGSSLSIAVSSTTGAPFLQSDTLAFIEFRTFIGNDNRSAITLREISVGDSECPARYEPQIVNGAFELDSSCFAALFHIRGASSKYALTSISPQPSSGQSADVEFNLAYASSVTFRVYDHVGREVVFQPLGMLLEGKQQISLKIGRLPRGLYYCEMTAGVFRDVKPLLVSGTE